MLFQRVRVQDYVKSVSIGKQFNSGKHVIHTLTSDSLANFNMYVCNNTSSPQACYSTFNLVYDSLADFTVYVCKNMSSPYR